MASVIHATAHGLVAGDAVRFGNVLPANAGVSPLTTYYVLAAGLTANAFEFSTTVGGTPFVLTHAITSVTLSRPDKYVLDSAAPYGAAPAPVRTGPPGPPGEPGEPGPPGPPGATLVGPRIGAGAPTGPPLPGENGMGIDTTGHVIYYWTGSAWSLP
jgi:hypothetical protein